MADDRVETVAVGRIGKAHGVRGEVFVEPWTDDPDARFAVGAVLATDPESRGPLTVIARRVSGGRLVIQFAGLEDRDGAEALRGTALVIASTDRPPLTDPDEFYDSDLVGLSARSVHGDDLGRVVDVLHGPAGDLLVLQIGDRERLVPFVAAIVPAVDTDKGVVEIDPPEGLLEL